jgi:23S rRNA pseudouridine1911/1915/1917 synthase
MAVPLAHALNHEPTTLIFDFYNSGTATQANFHEIVPMDAITEIAADDFQQDENADLELVFAPADRAEPRLDVWLSESWPDLSRSRWQKLVAAGNVRINDRPCTDKQYKLKAGDRVCAVLPPPASLDLVPEPIPLDFLYEDEHLAIVNKPAGMVVHPSAGHDTGTLVHALLAHCPLSQIGGVQRPGIVHRLDKDTSGAIAIAKTDLAHQSLQQQFQTKVARREYLGVVSGIPKTDRGTIDMPIGRHPIDRQKQAIVQIDRGGSSAITHWQIEEKFRGFALLRFRLETGRTHQIRVHIAQIGYPIVSDPVYGMGRSIPQERSLKLPGQALHAWQLELIHPLSGDRICATAPLPGYLQALLQVLRQQS